MPRDDHDAVARDLDQAIDRLVAGKPIHKRLAKLAADGRLAINPSTVALEAGRSRTLIAHAKCKYKAQRDRIVLLQNPGVAEAPRTASAVISKLRSELKASEARLIGALQAQANHLLARERAERDCERYRMEATRWRDEARRLAAAPGSKVIRAVDVSDGKDRVGD